jgi:hypothetical protein
MDGTSVGDGANQAYDCGQSDKASNIEIILESREGEDMEAGEHGMERKGACVQQLRADNEDNQNIAIGTEPSQNMTTCDKADVSFSSPRREGPGPVRETSASVSNVESLDVSSQDLDIQTSDFVPAMLPRFQRSPD